MAVLDADTGKVITTRPIGPGVDATDFDPATGNIFNSCGGGEGTLVVIHQDSPDKYSSSRTSRPAPAKTMAVDRKTHRVFIARPLSVRRGRVTRAATPPPTRADGAIYGTRG